MREGGYPGDPWPVDGIGLNTRGCRLSIRDTGKKCSLKGLCAIRSARGSTIVIRAVCPSCLRLILRKRALRAACVRYMDDMICLPIVSDV